MRAILFPFLGAVLVSSCADAEPVDTRDSATDAGAGAPTPDAGPGAPPSPEPDGGGGPETPPPEPPPPDAGPPAPPPIDWMSELSFEDVDAAQQPGYSRDGTPFLPSDFNHPRQIHNDQCVRASRDRVPLRYADFTPTGYVLDTAQLIRRHRLVDDDDGHVCRDGELQLDAQEILSTPMGRLLFFRGGYGYESPGNIKYGHVWIGDTMDHTDVRYTANGNGAACLASTNEITAGHYAIRPTALPTTIRYPKSRYEECRREGGTPRECSNGYTSYGDPGYEQGDPAVLGERYHYTYLVWSWVNVSGGGVVRALLAPAQVFHRCNVRSLRVDTLGDDGRVNGWTQAVYGKIYQAGNWLYGWTIYAHFVEGYPEPILHMERLDE